MKDNYKIVQRLVVMLTTGSYEIIKRYRSKLAFDGLWKVHGGLLIAKDEQKDNYEIALRSFGLLIVP